MGPAKPMSTACRRPWGLGHIVVGIFLAEAAVLVAASVFAPSIAGSGVSDLSLGTFALLQAALWFGTLGVPLWLVGVRGVSWSDLGWGFRLGDIWSGLIIGIGTQIVAVPLLYLPLLFLVEDLDVSKPARDLVDNSTGVELLVIVLVVAVGAPVVEELFYRGLMLRAFEDRMRPLVALIVSSLIFAAIHFQITQFPALFLFGFIAGRLAQKDGRLGRAIWAHVGFNGTTVLLLLLPVPSF